MAGVRVRANPRVFVMPKPSLIASALSVAALALALTACAGPTPGPAVDPGPTDPPVEQPTGTGDWTPDEEWFASLEERTTWLHDYVGFWDAQSCTMDKVISGDFNCNIHISGLTEGIDDLDALLAETIDVTSDALPQVEGLADARESASAGAELTDAYRDGGCDFTPDEACAETGEAVVRSAQALDEALQGWTRP
jgi:hypothetical protein